MKTALVTGANGFVGSHLVDALLRMHWHVKCLVRRHSTRPWLPEDRVELVFGEITQPSSLRDAIRGTDTLFHVAGLIRGRSEAEYMQVNAEGTANLVRAAAMLTSAPARIVLVSSLAAGGPSSPGEPRRESDRDAPASAYGRSKLMGELALKQNAHDIPWTIVRPPAVYGRRDKAFLVLARCAARGWIFRLGGPEQQASIIEVGDLVRGIIAASQSERTRGEVYYLAHPQPTSLRQMGVIMARILERRPREWRIPRALVPTISRGSGWLSRLSGRENRLPPDRAASLLAPGWVCSTNKALEEFGFRAQIETSDGIRDTLMWYREQGWLSS